MASVLRRISLDERHFFSEDVWRHFHFVLEYRDTDDVLTE